MEFDLLRRPARNHVPPEIEERKRKPMPIQRRMNVGASDDPHEREADRVADDVVRRLSGSDRPAPDDGVRVGAATRISRRETGGAPGDGFVAPAGVERSIQQARSGGAPLDASTRTKFEGAMGADLSGVRIHKDANADQLNRQVSAKAFTTGQDVFFSAGTYQPNSSAGQHLLAHELAHTVQQGGAVQRRTAGSDTIRRMTWDKVDFSTTTSVEVFSGGGSGSVAKFSDASGSIIVKVDQLIGNEVSVADKLAGGVAKQQQGNEFGVSAPGSRVASEREKRAIKAATLRHLVPNSDPRNFLTGLDSPNPVIIAEMKTGEKFLKFSDSKSITKDGASGEGKVLNTDAVGLKLLLQGPMLRALAQNGPADIVMGMSDRMMGAWNPENFVYDPAKMEFGFVDNTQNRNGGYLTSVDTGGGVVTHESSFRSWVLEDRVNQLRKKDLKSIAEGMVTTVAVGVGNYGLSVNTKAGRRMQEELKQLFNQHRAMLRAEILAGLGEGRKRVMDQLLKPTSLTSGVQSAKRNEAVTSLIARREYINGASANASWRTAVKLANKLSPPVADGPSRPVNAPPVIPPVQPPNNAQPGRANGPGRNPVVGGSHRRRAVANGAGQ